MPRIPVFKLGQTSHETGRPRLARYTPSLSLEGLQLGIDNLRHDVHLSPQTAARRNPRSGPKPRQSRREPRIRHVGSSGHYQVSPN